MQLLSFDSKLFGYPVYALQLNKINEIVEVAEMARELKQKEGKLLYLFLQQKADFEFIETPDYSIQFVDEKVNYQYISSQKESHKASGKSFTEPTINNEILRSLAYKSGQFSRFKVDPNFIKNEFELLYKLWLKKSLNREIATVVYAIEEEGIPKGLMTLKLNEDEEHATIGLLSVDPIAQRQGIGKALIEKAKEVNNQKGFRELYVATQRNNMDACRFYEKMKFKEKSNVFVYHLWTRC